ncbi:type II secretion system protein GspL [Thiomicrorhabdus aquaedulcis]|uniref:type II secretion system protein GspL n=1 Tax=Thiomicrorhabdus aquaedulcis TaxID=2211106 RepID=UPI000FDB444C|nr:type II secretion system protein GspL [Thiomicrorhabdus aquaedulcis]
MLQNVLPKAAQPPKRGTAITPVSVKFTQDDTLVVESLARTVTLPSEVDALLAELKAQGVLKSAVVTVWVPTQSVLLTQVSVPGKRKADWQAALPYALEESLSQPIEQFHIVSFARDTHAGNTVFCAVVERQKMLTWQAGLNAAGLEHAQLVPDCFALDWPFNPTNNPANLKSTDQAWLVYTTNQSTLHTVRTGFYSGFACDHAWFEQIRHLPEHQNKTLQAVEPTFTSASVLSALSLTKGDFKAQSVWGAGVKRLRWAGGLVALMLVTSMLATHWQTQRLAAQADVYQTQTHALFKQLFPDVKRVVNVRAQTNSRLKDQPTNRTQTSPMQMMRALEITVLKNPEVTLKKIALQPVKNGQRMSVQVSAANAAALQTLVSVSEAADVLTPGTANMSNKSNMANITFSLELKNVTATLAEGVLYVDAN